MPYISATAEIMYAPLDFRLAIFRTLVLSHVPSVLVRHYAFANFHTHRVEALDAVPYWLCAT
jgi:hypothetical protein